MKLHLRRFFLFAAVLWVFIGACPWLTQYFDAGIPQSTPEPTPSPTPAVTTASTAYFRIYNEADGTLFTVSDADFLPLALLCEMSADAPEEALKAQAVAIHTSCSRLRQQNTEADADFSCNTETCSVYTPADVLSKKYGEDWEAAFARVRILCAEVTNLCLYYDNALITAPYFALSAGCTQPYEDAFGGDALPYLQAAACPSDLLSSACRAETGITPETIRAAFPTIEFTDAPAEWFTDPQKNSAGYVKSIMLCGTALTGTQVRTALSLPSAAFTVTFDGTEFRFTTLGLGHGVGMSQTAAITMAENGADYTEILAYFYPGTELR